MYVLACGGSSSSEENVAKYSPKVANAGTINTGAAGNTGDDIDMALEVGAVTYEEFFTSIAAQSLDPQLENGAKLNIATSLIVNGKGERFVNEGASSIVAYYDALGSALIQDENMDHWTIFDASNEDATVILEAGVANGSVVKADSIEDLAKAMKVSPETLKAILEAYEAAVAAKEDKEFGKDAANLVSLAKGPFYAVKIHPTTFGSQGRVKTDLTGKVLDAKGNAIAGLYAVGEMSNCEFYYENYVLAASLGLYATTGRIAGIDVAKTIG